MLLKEEKKLYQCQIVIIIQQFLINVHKQTCLKNCNGSEEQAKLKKKIYIFYLSIVKVKKIISANTANT